MGAWLRILLRTGAGCRPVARAHLDEGGRIGQPIEAGVELVEEPGEIDGRVVAHLVAHWRGLAVGGAGQGGRIDVDQVKLVEALGQRGQVVVVGVAGTQQAEAPTPPLRQHRGRQALTVGGVALPEVTPFAVPPLLRLPRLFEVLSLAGHVPVL